MYEGKSEYEDWCIKQVVQQRRVPPSFATLVTPPL